MEPETLRFAPAGEIPNSSLPALVYRDVDAARQAGECIARFAANGWTGAWVDGIYAFHHFHSTAHEVLGIVAGSVSVALGGPGGRVVEAAAGDVLVLPAGTGHRNVGASADLAVVGAYPGGMWCDLRRGVPGERAEVMANLAAVPPPPTDPLHGPDGPLTRLWSAG